VQGREKPWKLNASELAQKNNTQVLKEVLREFSQEKTFSREARKKGWEEGDKQSSASQT
jgi:hypothetical protein